MDLGEARISKSRAALVGAISCRDVGSLGIGRQVKNISISTGRENHGIRGVGLHGPRHEIAHDDTARLAIH